MPVVNPSGFRIPSSQSAQCHLRDMTNYGILPFLVLSQSEDKKKAFAGRGCTTIYVLGSLVSFSWCDAVVTRTGTYGPHNAAAAAFTEVRMTMSLPYSLEMVLRLFTFEIHCTICNRRNAGYVARQIFFPLTSFQLVTVLPLSRKPAAPGRPPF